MGGNLSRSVSRLPGLLVILFGEIVRCGCLRCVQKNFGFCDLGFTRAT